MGQDALYVRWNGGGGIGDPLERDPEAVAHDVRDRIVSPEAATEVYGVVLSGGDIDLEKTNQRRSALRRDRLAQETA
jgi:N-methylhydantoinase B